MRWRVSSSTKRRVHGGRPQHRHAGCRSVENGAHEVDEARGRAILIESGRREFIEASVGMTIGSSISARKCPTAPINCRNNCDRNGQTIPKR